MTGATPVTPMFPLGSALLPGGVLPLHVFEPRYRQMMIELLERDGAPEFGEVLITRGREAGGGDERAMAGTMAQIVQMEALPGGRYHLVAVGTRRIRVLEWLPDDPYPRAVVEDWPDRGLAADPGHFAVESAAALVRVRAVLATAAELGDVPGEMATADVTLADDPIAASYHLAALAPIGPADRYRLLTAAGPDERLGLFDEILTDLEAVQRFRLG